MATDKNLHGIFGEIRHEDDIKIKINSDQTLCIFWKMEGDANTKDIITLIATRGDLDSFTSDQTDLINVIKVLTRNIFFKILVYQFYGKLSDSFKKFNLAAASIGFSRKINFFLAPQIVDDAEIRAFLTFIKKRKSIYVLGLSIKTNKVYSSDSLTKLFSDERLVAVFPRVILNFEGVDNGLEIGGEVVFVEAAIRNIQANGLHSSVDGTSVYDIKNLVSPVPYSLNDPDDDARVLSNLQINTFVQKDERGFVVFGGDTAVAREFNPEFLELNAVIYSDALQDALFGMAKYEIGKSYTEDRVLGIKTKMELFLKNEKDLNRISGAEITFPDEQIPGIITFQINLTPLKSIRVINIQITVSDDFSITI